LKLKNGLPAIVAAAAFGSANVAAAKKAAGSLSIFERNEPADVALCKCHIVYMVFVHNSKNIYQRPKSSNAQERTVSMKVGLGDYRLARLSYTCWLKESLEARNTQKPEDNLLQTLKISTNIYGFNIFVNFNS